MKIHLSHHPPWQREKFETQLHFDPGKGVTGWSHQDVPDVSGVESMKSVLEVKLDAQTCLLRLLIYQSFCPVVERAEKL